MLGLALVAPAVGDSSSPPQAARKSSDATPMTATRMNRVMRPPMADSRLVPYSGGNEHPPQNDEGRADQQREHNDQDRPTRDLGVDGSDCEPVDDVAAKSTERDVRGDGGGRHDLDRGGPDAEQDQRHRDWKLHLPENLPTGHAHSPRRIFQVGVDVPDPLVGIDQDRRNGQRGQRDQHRPEAGHATDRKDHDDDHAERGQCTGSVGDREQSETAATGVAGQHPERHRDDQRERERPGEVVQMLEQAGGDAVRSRPVRRVGQPPERRAQQVHAGLHLRAADRVRPRTTRVRDHGVRNRCATTSSASAASARRTISTTPMIRGVMKFFWNPSMNRSPSPPKSCPISTPTLTSEMLDTVAMRSPAMMTGIAIGNSTWTSRRSWPNPIAVAACRTGSGTPRSPSTTLGTSTTSV